LGEIYKTFERKFVIRDQTIARHLRAAGLLRFFTRINYVRRMDM